MAHLHEHPLMVYEEDGRVVLETSTQLAARIRRDIAAAWTGPASVVDELIAERRQAAAEEAAKLRSAAGVRRTE